MHGYPDVLTPVSFAVLFLAVCRVLYIALIRARSKGSQLPPGPTALPLLGNVHQLPMLYQEKTLAKWGKTYGGIVYARLFRTSAIVVNSVEVAQDLMEKRSANYSDRPTFILLSELMGWNSVVTHMPYGSRFKKHRKWTHEAFQTKSALEGYRPIQRREGYNALAGLLNSPGAYMQHFTRFSAATIMEITYGHKVTCDDDPYIEIADTATTATVTAGSPGSMLVDFFPILKHYPTWLPGSGFKTNALHVRTLVRRMLDTPYQMVKGKMEAGTAWPSFTSTLLEECYRNGRLTLEDEEDIKGAAGVLFGAGTETTATVLSTFALAMVRHPEIYKKAQEEIDCVIGSERLPDFDDRGTLPYLECIIKEVYRWHVPVPLGIPHNALKDDEYRGYKIPGKSMIIGNIWGMSQDETLYPQPEEFRPERYFDKSRESLLDPRNIVFGFGRRVCPGRDFADLNIFIVTSCIIAAFNLSKAKNERGEEITPPVEFTSGFVSRPKPFECVFTPRSQKAIDLIAQAQMNTSN